MKRQHYSSPYAAFTVAERLLHSMAFSITRADCWLKFSLFPFRTTRVFSEKLHSSWLATVFNNIAWSYSSQVQDFVFISIKLLWFYSHTSYVIQVPSFSIHLWPVSWTEQNRTLPSIIWCVPVLVVGLTPVCSSSILDSDFIIVSNVKQICSPTQGYCLNGLLLFKNQIMCISYKWIY